MLTKKQIDLFNSRAIRQEYRKEFGHKSLSTLNYYLKREAQSITTILSSNASVRWIENKIAKLNGTNASPDSNKLISESGLSNKVKSLLYTNWSKISDVPYEKATLYDLAQIETKVVLEFKGAGPRVKYEIEWELNLYGLL